MTVVLIIFIIGTIKISISSNNYLQQKAEEKSIQNELLDYHHIMKDDYVFLVSFSYDYEKISEENYKLMVYMETVENCKFLLVSIKVNIYHSSFLYRITEKKYTRLAPNERIIILEATVSSTDIAFIESGSASIDVEDFSGYYLEVAI